MYEYVRGRVADLTPTSVVLESGGIGYFFNISLQTFSQIASQSEVRLYVHFAVREDAQLFYGFYSRQERDIFRLLLGVSGVGGNTARMILSSFTPEEVATLIMTESADRLKTVKGLGLKTAQKIIVELRDKIGGILSGGTLAREGNPLNQPMDTTFTEAVSALTMLGFARSASEKVVKTLQQEQPAASVEDLVRQSLKRL